MKYMVLTLISFLLITGCSSSNNSSSNSEQPSNDFRTSEAIVLSKLEFEGKKMLLITEDVKKTDLDNFETILAQTSDEIIKSKKYEVQWLDIDKTSFDYDALKIGSKIKFTTYTEHLNTNPTTSIATEVNVIN
ncbi:hypothetical protein [Paenibacillus daejeonensis]|uniref:hypothetical protein n=1 Tax=Paenibacillus daejeonensis TaxID=135193 RepID=UPI00036C238E|nr:hypothetical protein [Paenibacillus daejeonensis]